jgi:hypothetical protein
MTVGVRPKKIVIGDDAVARPPPPIAIGYHLRPYAASARPGMPHHRTSASPTSRAPKAAPGRFSKLPAKPIAAAPSKAQPGAARRGATLSSCGLSQRS